MMKVGIYGVPAHPAGVSGIFASVAVCENAPARSAEWATDAHARPGAACGVEAHHRHQTIF